CDPTAGNCLIPVPVVAAMAGALIAAAMVLVSNYLVARKERLAWERENLFTSYSNCMYYLIKLSMSALAVGEVDRRSDPKRYDELMKDARQHIAESQRYSNILSLYNPRDETLQASRKQIEDNWNRPRVLSTKAEEALSVVKKLLDKDRRLGTRPS